MNDHFVHDIHQSHCLQDVNQQLDLSGFLHPKYLFYILSFARTKNYQDLYVRNKYNHKALKLNGQKPYKMEFFAVIKYFPSIFDYLYHND